jgi:hypothetical protein
MKDTGSRGRSIRNVQVVMRKLILLSFLISGPLSVIRGHQCWFSETAVLAGPRQVDL